MNNIYNLFFERSSSIFRTIFTGDRSSITVWCFVQGCLKNKCEQSVTLQNEARDRS